LALAEDAGRRDEARELARELERMERERAEFIRQVAREDRLGAMRRQLAEMAARLETLQAEGHDDRAAELERKIEQMHDELPDEEFDRED
jgi:hypothetical protein